MDSQNSSDHEGDLFEDAQDMATPRTQSRTRSLTDRRSSQSSSYHTRNSNPPPVPSMPNGDSNEKAVEASDDGAHPGKSPLLTAHRISLTSDMDDVSLEEDKDTQHSRSSSAATSPPAVPPKLPPRDSNGSTIMGLSGPLPDNHPPPPPPPKTATAPPPTSAPTRKLTSPFSWLGRHTSTDKKIMSPPLPAAPSHDRRNTSSTIGSNPELMLSRIDDVDENGEKRGSRNSLRDRFKLLRMREEAGIDLDDESGEHAGSPGSALAGLIGRSTSVGLGVGTPGSLAEEKDTHAVNHKVTSPGGATSPQRQPTTINAALAPGTAAGVSAGPGGDSAAPVDWDLWQNVVNEGPTAVARSSPEELSRAIASGIPQAIRGVIWQVLAESKNEGLEQVYKELVARGTEKERVNIAIPHSGRAGHSARSESVHVNGTIKEKESIGSSSSSVHSDYSTPATTTTNVASGSPSSHEEHNPESFAKLQANLAAERKKKAKEDAAALSRLEKSIKRDLGARTSYSKYMMAAGLQDGLFGLCKAYALFDEAVGYAQGMNFIAMPLLFNMPEEEAFCLFVRLMNKYGLRDMFIQDMPGLHLHLYQFERLLEDFEPALYCHLHRRGVSPQLYATQWFLTLFAYRFPLQLVLRIYDLILTEGLETAILKFGIVLMQKNAQTLLGMKDMSALTTFLKEKLFDVYIDKAPSANSILESGFFGSTGGIDKEIYRADMLVQDACSIKITPEMLKTYTTEWQERQRIEKEREREIDSLKQLTTSLSFKVRTLEERAEKLDTEHVQVASELVRTKVENETLSDENEAFKTKVDELQKIVDTQPEEVEARLKTEMETVMQKNIMVHNENRALEEQMADMEKILVETKMQYAQINSEHETLKQKWNDISKMLNR